MSAEDHVLCFLFFVFVLLLIYFVVEHILNVMYYNVNV
uniref:Uncharacterized protein n=1 Tax=Anguilla anguilla TaxID=7936 RepID=A0A0E9R9D8_ANGAN